MKKAFIFFSHKLTEKQIDELTTKWQCEKIISLPENLQTAWSNVNADADIRIFADFLKENSSEGDILLIQGEWGTTFNLINYAKDNNLVPIYAFSVRNSIEKKEGEAIIKTSVFEHLEFKRY